MRSAVRGAVKIFRDRSSEPEEYSSRKRQIKKAIPENSGMVWKNRLSQKDPSSAEKIS